MSADNLYPIWKWDAEVSMGYLVLSPNRRSARTETFSGGNADRINVDYDADGNVIGVEVFG